MDIKSILATAASMLFLSGAAGEHVLNNYRSTVDDVMGVCKPMDTTNVDSVRNPINGLRDVINWQLNNTSYDKDLFLQQVRLKVGNDSSIYDGIKLVVNPEYDEVKRITKILGLKATLDGCISKMQFINKLDYLRFNYAKAEQGTADEQSLLDDLTLSLEKVRTGGNLGVSKYLVREIDLSNIESIKESIDAGMDLYSNTGILTFGLQGFNDLFGDHQGIRRGETVVVSALQHKWKSGVLLTSLIQACFFNEPTYIRLKPPIEGEVDKRKALMLHITLENDALGDLLHAYKYIREQQTGEETSITNLSVDEKAYAANYVYDEFRKQGFEVKIAQYAAGEFGYANLFALVENYEALGYEIHMITLDYMGKMSTRGCVTGPHGKDIQDLYQRVQNFMLRKKIAFMTAHQMSTEAKALERNGEAVLVEAVCELGYYAGCRTVDNEVDMEIYQHLVSIGGKKYVTWKRGKHRKPGTITPDAQKFCVYQMQNVATIPWDAQGDARYSRRLSGYGNNDVSADMF